MGIAWLGPVLALPAPVRGVGMALALLVLPLATVLVPVLLLRRVPRRKRKVAWQLLVPLVAGAAVGMLGTPPVSRPHWRSGVSGSTPWS